MNRQRLLAIAKKDFKEAVSNSQILLPLIIVPLICVAVMPAGVILGARFGADNANFMMIIHRFPPTFFRHFSQFSDVQKMIYFFTVYFFAPFFLMVPAMVSMMLSANSFAGEKERLTLEGILYTPITDSELITGKILASFATALGVSWICFFVYAVLVNSLAMPVFSHIFFPTLNWWILMFVVLPPFSLAVISLMVIISAKVKGYQEANSLAGMVVLPLIAITIGQATGVLYFSAGTVFLTGLFFFVLDIILLRLAVRVFHRNRLISYLK